MWMSIVIAWLTKVKTETDQSKQGKAHDHFFSIDKRLHNTKVSIRCHGICLLVRCGDKVAIPPW